MGALDLERTKVRSHSLHYSTDRLKPECSPAPGPSVASAEIQGASAVPSQTLSLLLSRTGEYRLPSGVSDRASPRRNVFGPKQAGATILIWSSDAVVASGRRHGGHYS